METETRPIGVPEPSPIQTALNAHFDKHATRPSGHGDDLTYITGEQCASRLNDVLGYNGWSFRITEHGIHSEADEIWVLGELVVQGQFVRQQFGSQKIKRAKTTGTIIDIGFDLKGAATDAMKKCASLIGVGLYLYDKDELRAIAAEMQNGQRPARQAQRSAGPATQPPDEDDPYADPMNNPTLTCVQCRREFQDRDTKNGLWLAKDQYAQAVRKYGKALCWPCSQKGA